MAAINPLLLLLEEQAVRIDDLEGQVQDLTLALHFDATANVQAAFNITETLAQLLILLSDGKPKNKDKLHAALYFRRPEAKIPEQKICDTLICKLRKHLDPFGVTVETIWAAGYKITAGLEVVRCAIEYGSADDYQQREAARQRKRERERMWRKAVRAAHGGKDRQTYLQQSLTRLRPWEELGVSRRTWERRRVAGFTNAANDDAPASKQISDSQAAA